MYVSIIVPCYNESATINEILTKIHKLKINKEIIVINDCSTDETLNILKKIKDIDYKLIDHDKNYGKGAALRTGFYHAKGDIVLIQDADLEYNPEEVPKLIKPIIEGHADVVYGSRFRGGDAARVLYFWHRVGNWVLTLLSNMFTNLNLTDMETCYKVFTKEVINKINIQEDRFGFEPEITAKISKIKPKLRIYEIGISYNGRTYEDGKKIGWKDGVRASYAILKYNLSK